MNVHCKPRKHRPQGTPGRTSRFWQRLEKSIGRSGEENAATDKHGTNTEKKGGKCPGACSPILSPSVFIPCFSVAAFCIFACQYRKAHPFPAFALDLAWKVVMVPSLYCSNLNENRTRLNHALGKARLTANHACGTLTSDGKGGQGWLRSR